MLPETDTIHQVQIWPGCPSQEAEPHLSGRPPILEQNLIVFVATHQARHHPKCKNVLDRAKSVRGPVLYGWNES